MELPRITIVTPSYNQDKFLHETIQSVHNQDYPNLEYFIVDGGSKDNSIDIFKKYEDKIDWWVSEKDKGQADAINRGFLRASGEILCWVNSDDILLPNCLHEVAKNYLKNNKPELIHSNCVYINEDGLIIKLIRIPKQTRFFVFRGVWSMPAPAVFFKASFLKKVGYLNMEYHLSMDLDICMRIIKAGGRISYIPKYLGAYRWHATSKTSIDISNRKKKNIENYETKLIYNSTLPGSTESSRKLWKILWKVYRMINLNYLRSFLETTKATGLHWKKVFSNRTDKT